MAWEAKSAPTTMAAQVHGLPRQPCGEVSPSQMAARLRMASKGTMDSSAPRAVSSPVAIMAGRAGRMSSPTVTPASSW